MNFKSILANTCYRLIHGMKLKKEIPPTLDSAIEFLYTNLSEKELKFIKSNDHSSIHHFGGMQLRNDWNLWNTKSALNKDIQKRFGLMHGDDCSGLIFTGLWAKVKGENVNDALNNVAESYINHWKRSGVNPMTGEPIKGVKPPSTMTLEITKDGIKIL